MGHVAQAKQGVNSEMFLRNGKKGLVLNYVICLIHEDRFSIPIKPRWYRVRNTFSFQKILSHWDNEFMLKCIINLVSSSS